MIVYVYRNCSTCKKAVGFLEKHKIEAIIREITAQPPVMEELKEMLGYQKNCLKKLFNTSGDLYREMNLSQILEQKSLEEALTLLTQNGMLVKRPFLIGNGVGLLGFKEEEWTNTLC